MSTRLVVFEVRFDDSTLLAIAKDPAFAEEVVVNKFKETANSGDDLVMINEDGLAIYTTRTNITEETTDDDGFEYVDNDGNAIRPDGSAILDEEKEAVSDELRYEVSGDFYWTIQEVEEDTLLNVSAGTDLYTEMTMSSVSPFEDEERIAIVATA